MGYLQTEAGKTDSIAANGLADGRKIFRVIDTATPAQSGSFLDWRGETLPW